MLIILAPIAIVVFLALYRAFKDDFKPPPAPQNAPASTSSVSSPPSPGVEKLEIPTSGREVFSFVLDGGRVYKLLFSGTCQLSSTGFFGGVLEIDAAYSVDCHQNFSKPHERTVVNGRSLRDLDCFLEDRAMHLYTGWVDGDGNRICFRIAGGNGAGLGTINVVIQQLPRSTVSPSSLRRAESQRLAEEQAAERRAQEVKKQEEAEARKLAERERKIAEFKRQVHQNRYFLDAEFQREYVRKNGPSLLSNLGQVWVKEYEALFEDGEMVAALKSSAPEVLEWHEKRLDMIVEAKRAEIIPEKVSPPPLPPQPSPQAPVPNRQITATTMGHVSRCIQELFQFTEMFDRESQALALDNNERSHEPKVSRAIAGMAYCYKDLKRFGIDADSPEAAEMQFFQLCPPPALTVYEELIQKLKKRKSVPPDALCERLEDLHREKIILQARRRASIRQGDDQERDDLDRRLADVRREATEIKAFLEAIKVPVEFKDRHESEQELSLEEKFIRLYSGKKRVIDYLTKEGDVQTVEHVEALYAQEQAKLFEQDASYT